MKDIKEKLKEAEFAVWDAEYDTWCDAVDAAVDAAARSAAYAARSAANTANAVEAAYVAANNQDLELKEQIALISKMLKEPT